MPCHIHSMSFVPFCFTQNVLLNRKKLQRLYRGAPTSTVSTCAISTSTNFQKVLHKVVLVGDLISKFVLVELTLCTTQLVRISHSTIFSRSQKSYYAGTPCIKKIFCKKVDNLDYRGSPLSTNFGTWKKSYYAKFVLVEQYIQSTQLVRIY